MRRNHHSFVKCGRFIHLKPRKLVHAVSRKLTRLSKSHQRTRSHSGIVEEGRLEPKEEGDSIVCTHRSNLDEGHEAETVKNCEDQSGSRKQKHGGNDDLHCRTLSQQRQRQESLSLDNRRRCNEKGEEGRCNEKGEEGRCNEEGEEVGGEIFSSKNQEVEQNEGTAVVNVGETNDCDDNQCIEVLLEISGPSENLDDSDELLDSTYSYVDEDFSSLISLVSRVSPSSPIKDEANSYDTQPNLASLWEKLNLVAVSEDSLSFVSYQSTPSTPRNKPEDLEKIGKSK